MDSISWVLIVLFVIGYFGLMPRIKAKKSLNKPAGIETFLLWTMAVLAVLFLILRIAKIFV